MNIKFLGMLVVFSIATSGCKTMGDQESYAAVIAQPNAESLLELTKAVSTAMDGRSVKIAENALTTSNTLSISANTQRTLDNNPVNGRIQERPQHFKLMLRGAECFLVHDETGIEYTLEYTVCSKMDSY